MELPDDLEGLTLPDLRNALSDAGYSSQGSKQELLQRIRSLSL